MKGLIKIIFSVILFFLPVMLVIGLVRKGLGADNFLPDTKTFIEIFNQFPDLSKYIQEDITDLNNTLGNWSLDSVNPLSDWKQVADCWGAVTTFEWNVGNWFIGIGKAFYALGQTLTYFFTGFGFLAPFLSNLSKLVILIFKLLYDFVSIPVQIMVWFFSWVFNPAL